MNDARSREPHSDKYRAELCQPDAGWCLEDIQVLQNIWHWHEAEGSKETQPCEWSVVQCPLHHMQVLSEGNTISS